MNCGVGVSARVLGQRHDRVFENNRAVANSPLVGYQLAMRSPTAIPEKPRVASCRTLYQTRTEPYTQTIPDAELGSVSAELADGAS